MSAIAGISLHECCTHCSDEDFGFVDHLLCILHFNRITLVVGHVAERLRVFQEAAHLLVERSVLDEPITEGVEYSLVRFANFCARRQQRGTGRIEHGVIGAVARAISIAGIEQYLR